MTRILKWLGIALLGVALALLALLWAIDTGPGHRFLAERIARLGLASGLRIEIGRIDGSIYGEAVLRDLRVYDAKGLLFDSPAVALDWQPWQYARNRLVIDSLTAEIAALHKRPQFNPSAERGPILPGFDIALGELRIDRLRVEPAVSGARRFGRLSGRAEIRDGRADVYAAVAVDGGPGSESGAGDRLIVRLDAEPDRDRFDLETRLAAPAGGAIGALIGTDRPLALTITGDGRWSAWRGRGQIDWGGQRVADLDLSATQGTYRLGGTLAPSLITRGKLAAMTAPVIRVMGTATLEERRLGGRITLGSRALAVRGEGTLDLARSAFDNVRITANLLRPETLLTGMSGDRVQLVTQLDGPFDTARFDYLLSAPRVAFDRTGFEGVEARGGGRLTPLPVAVPLTLTARRVTGVGDVAGGLLTNLRVEGLLRVSDRTLVGDGLRVGSDRLRSTVSVFVDFATGRYDIAFNGQIDRYLIPGLGVVDVRTVLNLVPGEGGRGFRVVGRGQAIVRRLDNAFFASLTRGLPRIETGLERGPDGVLYLRGLRLVSPGLNLTGNGLRRNDGTFFFEGGGRSAQYGPVRLTLDGNIARPRVALVLARPLDAAGLRDVRVNLDPTASGFAFRASGGSTLGPFSGNGAILLPRGRPAIFDIAALTVAGTTARGRLTSVPGGFRGRLAVAGGGLDGGIDLAPVRGVQRIAADLTANGVRFAGPPPLSIRRGRIQATALLDPAGATIDATVTGEGISRGNIRLARLAANARLRGGAGRVTASFAGSRGRAFDLQTVTDIAPGRIRVTGQGTIDRRPVRLTTPAVLTREAGGWRMARTGLEFAGGQASVAGLFGEGATELDAQLTRLPLSILDIFYPDAGVGGIATGTVRYRLAGADPSGRVDLRVRGLTRSGLVVSSRPLDVGVTGVLDRGRAAFRAVAANGGQVIGRAQGRIGPLTGGLASLATAPLFAQVRYNGAADTLWRLTGVELFDLTGGVAIGADIGGTIARPQVRGSVRTTEARLESPVTGTVLTRVAANGRFNGSRLLIDSLTAKAGDGDVSARGAINLAGGLGIDLAVQANNARLINRDDLGASVTGPLTIRSNREGGVIGGNVELTRGRFTLGRATAAQQVPRLRVREINRRDEYFDPPPPPPPWRLAIKARADNRLTVTGLGLDSEWRADLDIGGAVNAPAITGRAELVRGGYEFAGRRFDLERGVIRFTGAVPADPTVDILAQSNLQGLNATIRVTGTGQRPQIAFSSVPALPEDELLSRLLFGTSITNLSAAEALQLGAAVASLRGGGGGLDPINAVRRAVGLDRLRILPADATTGQRTSVAAGKYITRRVYAEVITDGQGYSATRVEFQITRWLSLLSTISTIGRQSVNARVSRDY